MSSKLAVNLGGMFAAMAMLCSCASPKKKTKPVPTPEPTSEPTVEKPAEPAAKPVAEPVAKPEPKPVVKPEPKPEPEPAPAPKVSAIPDPLPDPDGKEADMTKPVQVFILMGQSNMLRMGRVGPATKDGALENAVKNKGLYPYLIDDAGNWTERKDVRDVQVMGSGGPGRTKQICNQWLGVKSGKIGVEIGIGSYLGYALEAPVMVLKSAIGNRSLSWDLLPPGTPRYSHKGKESPGYGETWPSKKDRSKIVPFEKGKTLGWYAGMQYDGDIDRARKVLADLGKYYPGATKYEVAGFLYWQGDKDRYNEAHAAAYEQNLVRLIRQLRKDFDAPDAKFVCATLGQTKKDATGNEKLILDAQLAVDGRTGKYPEFKGNVAAVYSNPLSKGGASNGHYSGNAETYMNVGEAMGKAMVELLQN